MIERGSLIYECDFNLYKNFEGILKDLRRLKKLGVTHIELMPIMQHSNIGGWGYCWDTLENIHSSYGDEAELKCLIDSASTLDIYIIIDVVFNHSSNIAKVQLNKEWYSDDPNPSGCGNTFDSHNQDFQEYILKHMRWLKGLGVNGFRFDLAGALDVNKKGHKIYKGSLLERVDKEFKDMIRIYEPWSCVGYYKSKFSVSGYEWNDKLRDSIRRYILDYCSLEDVVYEMNQYSNNINYITCHDGFSLWDFINYDHKNNWANGESNKDGNPHEVCRRVEDDKVELLKKALKLLIISKGIPMLRGGDEFLSTFEGCNNNWKGLVTSKKIMDIQDYISYLMYLRGSIDYSIPIEIYSKNKLSYVTTDGLRRYINI
ncbi:MAG: alpha-amylase family glycosyl hydrolase [Cetobacterium sp.]